MVTTTQLKARAPRLTRAFFLGRRKQFFSRLPENSIAIIVSHAEMTRSNDTEFPYRQSSDVLYLSGFSEPETVLVLKKSKGRERFIMFVRPRDLERETWTGRRLGVEAARSKFGCAESHGIEDFGKVMEGLLEGAEQVFYKLERNPAIDKIFVPLWIAARQKPLHNPDDILHPMRQIKEPIELDCMRHAAEISAHAHSEAMRRVRPGMHEFEIQSIIHGVSGASGAPEQAYNTIAAGGANAVILHYNVNSDKLAGGDLLLVDAGCEFRGYASDITRTYPVNGKFSDAQKEVYELVLAAQLAAIKAAKPGASINRVHAASENVMRRGLVKLGILPSALATRAAHDRFVARAEKDEKDGKVAHLGRWFMHGTSHWLGLDVHDVCGLSKEDGKELPLAPGMVITVEPGLYFRPDDKLVPRRYRGIGIRIEDDVVITADGCDVITAGVPKTVSGIEQLMAGSGR